LGGFDGITLGHDSGNDKQSLKRCSASYPRMRGTQYAAAAVVDGTAGVYWIIRCSLSSGSTCADPMTEDDKGASHA
jgi:hypothetical protein